MASLLLPLHLLSAGLWVGCVATELVFERLLADQHAQRSTLGELHQRVDWMVELPAAMLTLLTGLLLWLDGAPSDALLGLKIAAGAVAVVANLWCMRAVLLRARAGAAGDAKAWTLADQDQHRRGSLVVLGLLAALALGLARWVAR